MEVAAPPPTVIPPPRWKIAWANYRRLIGWCAISFFVGVSIVAGIALRRATWEVTKPIRFGDIQHGFSWAMQSSGPQGYLNQYEKMDNEDKEDAGWGNWLDYAPLRLLLMDQWGHWVRRHYSMPVDPAQEPRWNAAYAFNRPLLDFNTLMDGIAAVSAFFLTRLWYIRTRCRNEVTAKRSPFTGILPGLVAALTLWINPAMLLSAYGWPTWDAWIVPMYLLAALLASLEWWFAAGVVIAVGAMFKGQQLTVAPVFIIWALMLGQVGAAARWCAGVTLGMAVIASPWLFSYIPAHVLPHVRWTFFVGSGAPDFGYIPRTIDYPAIAWVVAVIAVTALAPLLAERIALRPLTSRALWPLKAAVIIALVAMWTLVLLPMSPLADPRLRDGVSIVIISLMTANLTLAIMRWRAWKAARASPPGPISRASPRPLSNLDWRIFAGTIIFVVALWPWLLAKNRPDFWLGVMLSAALAAAAVGLRRASRPFVVAAAAGTAALLCIVVFHGSHAWWDCGFHFGTIHWQSMIMGHTDNLPGLLQVRYGWPDSALEHAVTLSPLFHHLPIFSRHHLWPAAPLDLSIKKLFDGIYTILLVISGIGLGLHARRRDPRFLVALITPWALFFTIPVQIHERYLLFAAGAAAICIGQGVGTWLLGLLLSFITFAMTLHVMLLYGGNVGDFGVNLSILFPWLFAPDCGHPLFRYIAGTFPDAAWAVILTTAIFLYLSLVPTRRPRLPSLDNSAIYSHNVNR